MTSRQFSRKRIGQALWLLALGLTFLVSGYGHAQAPMPPYAVPALNAFGTCPDAIRDHFMKDRRIPPPFAVPGSTDLLRAQLRRERDPFGQELFAVEAEALETIPRTISHAQTVFFFALDVDRDKRTGQPEPVFDLGMDLSFVAQFNLGSAPRFFALIWAVGGFTSLTLNVTGRINERFLRMEIPLATLEAQYRSVRGAALALDDPLWGVYTGYWPKSPSEEPAFDIFPERSARSPLPRPGAEFIDGELLVHFKEGVTTEQAQQIITQLGTRVKRLFEIFSIYHLEITDGTDVLTKVKQFQARPEVDVAEVNGIWCLAQGGAPNDRNFAMQWNLSNQGQSHPVARGTEQRGRAGADIQIMRAWGENRTDSSAVLIGVIDSGADLAHPDLATNLRRELGFDFIQNDATPEDNIGHGTFVSSLIGAIGNNGADLTGVSWKTALIPLKAADKLSFFQRVIRMIQGVTWDNFLQAMERAIKLRIEGRNLRVINFSAGGPLKSDLLDDVIRLAGEKGILFVTAAGNDGRNLESNPIYPCAYNEANLICVAASTDEDKLASFSNFSANFVHLVAPGADVVGLIPSGLKPEAETLLGNAESRGLTTTVAVSNGTSFAAPHVTAVAALLFASCPATITVADTKRMILDAAERKPELAGKVTGGRLRWPERLPVGCQ